jgi:hypothetical protein
MVIISDDVKNTFSILNQMGVFENLKSVGSDFNRFKEMYEINGLYHGEDGYKNKMIARWDDAADCVDFENLVRDLIAK